jgi:hypothetical protein
MPPIFEAEHVARKMERVDLTATIREKFVAPNSTFDDLIDKFRRFSLAKDFGL